MVKIGRNWIKFGESIMRYYNNNGRLWGQIFKNGRFLLVVTEKLFSFSYRENCQEWATKIATAKFQNDMHRTNSVSSTDLDKTSRNLQCVLQDENTQHMVQIYWCCNLIPLLALQNQDRDHREQDNATVFQRSNKIFKTVTGLKHALRPLTSSIMLELEQIWYLPEGTLARITRPMQQLSEYEKFSRSQGMR